MTPMEWEKMRAIILPSLSSTHLRIKAPDALLFRCVLGVLQYVIQGQRLCAEGRVAFPVGVLLQLAAHTGDGEQLHPPCSWERTDALG